MEINRLIEGDQNKWHNLYWFSRMLISSDKYIPIGKEPSFLTYLVKELRQIGDAFKGDHALEFQLDKLRSLIEKRYEKSRAKSDRVNLLLTDLEQMIKTPDDMEVFIFTCENVLIPLKETIDKIPSNDRFYTIDRAKRFLDIKGEFGLATIINLWDDLGLKGCLNEERNQIVLAFDNISSVLKDRNLFSEDDQNIILTAFVQEFERRSAQKRKQRAGGSLQDVTSFILDYYKIKQANAPEHFQADIEVDNWIKTKDNWLIGISCKRTIRERWKQVSSAEATILSKFKIKNIYHIVTFDEDLSDDKLALLGAHRHVFYLPDSSRILKHASEHIGLSGYVRPISSLINDLKSEM